MRRGRKSSFSSEGEELVTSALSSMLFSFYEIGTTEIEHSFQDTRMMTLPLRYTYLKDYLSYSGHTSIMSNHSSANPVTILAQSLTVGRWTFSPLSSIVLAVEGRVDGRS